jgi:hypothetical protein
MLEVLAAVQPCREPRLAGLEALILKHRTALSGCLLVLLEWDAARRALVKRLRGLGLPLWVLLLVPAGGAGGVEAGAPEEQPDRLVVLEAGAVGPALWRLGEGA